MKQNTAPNLQSIPGSLSHESRIAPLLTLLYQLQSGAEPQPEAKAAAVATCKTFQAALVDLYDLCGLVPKHDLDQTGVVISDGETWALPGTSAHHELSGCGANVIIGSSQLDKAGTPAHQDALKFLGSSAFIWVPLLISSFFLLVLGVLAAVQTDYGFSAVFFVATLWAVTWTVPAFRHSEKVHEVLEYYDELLACLSFGPRDSAVIQTSVRPMAGLLVLLQAKYPTLLVCLFGAMALLVQGQFPGSFWVVVPLIGLVSAVFVIRSTYLHGAKDTYGLSEFEAGVNTLAESIEAGYWEQVVGIVDSDTLDQIDSFVLICEDLGVHPLDLDLTSIGEALVNAANDEPDDSGGSGPWNGKRA